MLVLLISLPVYSANVLAASLRITKNAGAAGVPGFIDANGDEWQVEATITGVAAVQPEQVRLQVGPRSEPFNDCRSDTLGTVCSYQSQLSEGVPEGSYPFTVNYLEIRQSAVILADGSAPQVSHLQVAQQTDGTINLGFLASDNGGLKRAAVLDEQNTVLQEIPVPAGQTQLSYNGQLQGINSGQGLRSIKVLATDQLGHESASSAVSFRTDFVAPTVEKINITALGQFIGITSFRSDIVVDVRDASEFNYQLMRVSSPQTSLQNANPGANACQRDRVEFDLWHCRFSQAVVNPAAEINFNIYVSDRFGNSNTVSQSLSYTVDSAPPLVIFFGSERVYEGQSYVNSHRNRIILKFKEEGAGITANGIRADLRGVGGLVSEAPDYFNATTQEAYWDITATAGGAHINLVKFQDNAGNEDPQQLVETALIVDTSGPRVERLEFYGFSEASQHDYYQSQDQLKMEFTAREDSGLRVQVNLNELVDSAALKYPARLDLPAGWLELTQDDGCERAEGLWECKLLVPESLRSGTGRDVGLQLKIRDTSGNEAIAWGIDPRNIESKVSNGNYKIKLLGLSEEEDPDYWEVGKVKTSQSFVDLDTVNLAPARMQFSVPLRSLELNTEVLSVDLGSCEALEGAPKLRSSLLYGGIAPGGEGNPTVNVILEFEPFDGRQILSVNEDNKFEKITANYQCQLKIFTKLNRQALQAAELQVVPLTAEFAFSSNGAVDENIAKKVKELKDNDLFKIANAIHYLAVGFKILNFVTQIFQTIVSLNQLVNLFTTSTESVIETYRTNVYATVASFGTAEAAVKILQGSCYAMAAGTEGTWEIVRAAQIPMNILACNPGVTGSDGKLSWDLDWYGKWQRTVLDLYNLLSLRGVLGIPANSLQENLIVSSIGLCLPGIVLNVEKARELHCRKILCYAQDVPAGLTTIEGCDRLYDVQMCEFVLGSWWDFVGFGAVAEIGQLIQSFLSSPVGLFTSVLTVSEILTCATFCLNEFPAPGTVSACRVFTGIDKAIAMVDNIVGAVQTAQYTVGSAYCDQVDDIKLEELAGGQFLEKEEEIPPEEGQPSRTPEAQPQTNI